MQKMPDLWAVFISEFTVVFLREADQATIGCGGTDEDAGTASPWNLSMQD